MLLSGRWSYDTRGLLDEGQLHFFTGPEMRAAAGRRRLRAASTRDGRDCRARPTDPHALAVVDGVGLAVRPTLFAYQYLFEVANPPVD